MARFETMTTSDEDGTPKLSSARLTEISTALERAQDELITTAADPILP
jgi:hypothetical protein